jgi:hypothetical protein
LPIDASSNGANAELFWAIAQRLFSFDDPARTLAQIRKTCARWRTPSNAARVEVSVPAGKSQFVADRIFTALFTLETALKIRGTHWDAWACQNQDLALSQDCIDDFEQDFAFYASARGAGQATLRWCLSVLRMNLPWHALAGAGSWADDARAAMVANLLDAINGSSCLTIRESLFNCTPLFQQYVLQHRCELPVNFLPQGILLVEGTTEAILFPRAASCLGTSFESCGLLLLAAGGANQVVKRFMQLKEMVVMPIACALDADAAEQAQVIRDGLREHDQLHVLQHGEVEDAFSARLFTELLNQYLQASLASSDAIKLDEFVRLSRGQRKTRAAHQLLRQRASIDFDKVQFAKLAAQRFQSESDIPEELRYIVRAIAEGLSGAADGTR